MKKKHIFIALTMLPLLATIAASLPTSSVSRNVGIKKELDTSTSLGIYRDLTKEEIKAYYGDLTLGDKEDSLLTNLQPILKKNQVKLNYDSGNTSSTAWKGYYLFERNWEKSPLQESEKTGTYKTSGIWLNILYSASPIYIETKINSGTYKYLKEDGTEVSDTFVSSNKQFDREHVFPKSFGFNDSSDNERYKNLTAGCDIHNLHAGEHEGNSTSHSNYPYGTVVTKNSSTEQKSKLTGELVGYTGNDASGNKVFEPLDHEKGDIARSLFYMCARYHTYDDSKAPNVDPALSLANNISSTPTANPESTKTTPMPYGQLDDLLKWNKLDPVDEHEIHRNNLVYNSFQKNRNPFIDYPAWADVAFKSSTLGIDLSTDDGLEVHQGINVSFKDSSKNYLVDEKLNLDDLDMSYVDATLGKHTLAFSDFDSIKIKDPNSNETTFTGSPYTFEKEGEYVITFVYKDGANTFEKSFSIQVIKEQAKPFEIPFYWYIIGVVIIMLFAFVFLVIFKKNNKSKKSKKRK